MAGPCQWPACGRPAQSGRAGGMQVLTRTGTVALAQALRVGRACPTRSRAGRGTPGRVNCQWEGPACPGQVQVSAPSRGSSPSVVSLPRPRAGIAAPGGGTGWPRTRMLPLRQWPRDVPVPALEARPAVPVCRGPSRVYTPPGRLSLPEAGFEQVSSCTHTILQVPSFLFVPGPGIPGRNLQFQFARARRVYAATLPCRKRASGF
jgi:hypothetical protein